MKKILLTSPTALELGDFTHDKVDLLLTGIGVPATIYHLQKALLTADYDLVIQIGICGTFNSDTHPIGLGFVVEKDCFAELGAIDSEGFSPLHEMGYMLPGEAGEKDGWFYNENARNYGLPTATSMTVSTVNNLSLNDVLKKHWQPDLESMEGAALHYVCLKEKINFLQLRAVSNVIGDRDIANWKMKEAVEKLHEIAHKIIDNA